MLPVPRSISEYPNLAFCSRELTLVLPLSSPFSPFLIFSPFLFLARFCPSFQARPIRHFQSDKLTTLQFSNLPFCKTCDIALACLECHIHLKCLSSEFFDGMCVSRADGAMKTFRIPCPLAFASWKAHIKVVEKQSP